MKLWMGIIISFLFTLNCNEQSGGNISMVDQEFIDDLKSLQRKKIYFAHQSVGKNILQGLEELVSQQSEVKFSLIDLDAVDTLPEHFFAHSRIGANADPEGKCDDFFNVIDKRFSGKLDIGIMKFCYVDIAESTDVKSLFEYYQKIVSQLKQKFPNITFIHTTVPLMANSGGWKIKIKRLINYQDYTDPANIKRNEFNNMLIKQYRGEPIFDLARIESTYPNGKRESFKYGGKTYYSLIREYTHDGGHLNSLGSQLAAREMIRSIAQALKQQR